MWFPIDVHSVMESPGVLGPELNLDEIVPYPSRGNPHGPVVLFGQGVEANARDRRPRRPVLRLYFLQPIKYQKKKMNFPLFASTRAI